MKDNNLQEETDQEENDNKAKEVSLRSTLLKSLHVAYEAD